MVDTSPTRRRRAFALHTFDAFANRGYTLLWSATFCSNISRWMQMTLLGWMVLELTDSPLRVALVGFFGMAPNLMLGGFGGVLADRLDRRRLLMALQATNFVATLVMTVLLATGSVQFWHAYWLIFVSGVGHALDYPSRRALILDLLGRSRVANALALDVMAFSISRMAGPAMAGALIKAFDVVGGYVVVTIIYLLAVPLLWSLRAPSRAGSLGGVADMFRNLMEGFRYVRGNRTIMAVILITVLMNILLFSYVQMTPVIARDVLGVGPGLMGILIATDGLGGLVGAIAIASITIRFHGRVYMGGSALSMLALLLFAFSPMYALSLPTLFVLGLGSAGFGAMQATIILLVARDDMRGRALGVTGLAIGAAPLGAVLVGAVATIVSPTFAIGMNAVLGIAAIGLVALLMPSLRQEITAPETAPPLRGAARQPS